MYKLTLTSPVSEDDMALAVTPHEGDDAEALWDLVDINFHLKAVLTDADGVLISKFTSSNYTEAE